VQSHEMGVETADRALSLTMRMVIRACKSVTVIETVLPSKIIFEKKNVRNIINLMINAVQFSGEIAITHLLKSIHGQIRRTLKAIPLSH
jgi:hypothetical protein